MAHIAFLFAGQGAQHPGMGRELYDCSAAARRVFDAAEALRPGTRAQCFEGSAEELTLTSNTQPCLWCVDLAAAEALREAGAAPSAVAGFSLGELAALTFAGAFALEEGFSLVCKRGELMQRAGEENPGKMAAVLKLDDRAVAALCEKFEGVWPVNFNCPGQVTVAAVPEALEPFLAAVKEAKGRAVPLAVSGGFHSPLMEPAAQGLAGLLAGRTCDTYALPVYANSTAAPYPAELGAALAAQVKSPVRWRETLEAMAARGIDTFIEVGPGKALSGFVKKTLPEARVYNVEDRETLEAAVKEVRPC